MNALIGIACLLLGAPQPIAQQDVTVGPALLTYPQLARALSGPGRTVVCDSFIKSRALFVCLRNRSWQDTRDVLRQGLDVEFRHGLDGSWVMRAEPEVQNRERTWLRTLAANVRLAFEEVIESANLLGIHNYPDYLDRKQEMANTEREIDLLSRNEPMSPAVREERNALRTVRTYLAKPEAWMMVHLMQSGMLDHVEEALRTGSAVRRIDPLAALALVPFDKLNSDIRNVITQPGSSAFCGLDYRGFLSGVGSSITLYGADGKYHGVHGIETSRYRETSSIFYGRDRQRPVLDPDAKDPPGLGPAAVRWLEDEQSLSRAFISTPVAAKGFRLSSRLPSTSVSQLVEAWSAANDAGEVVMELIPSRELIDELPAFTSPERPKAGAVTTLAQVFQDDGSPWLNPWTVTGALGVVLVRDRMAFLDRSRQVPFGGLFPLEKASTDSPLGAYSVPSYEAARACADSMNPSDLASWRNGFQYRSMTVGTVAAAYETGPIWDRVLDVLTESQRTDVRMARTVEIPFAKVAGPKERALFVERIRVAAGTGGPPVWPGLLNALADAALTIHRVPGTVDVTRPDIELSFWAPGEHYKPLWQGGLARVDLACLTRAAKQ